MSTSTPAGVEPLSTESEEANGADFVVLGYVGVIGCTFMMTFPGFLGYLRMTGGVATTLFAADGRIWMPGGGVGSW